MSENLELNNEITETGEVASVNGIDFIPPAEPVLEEKVYRYQPTDEDNRPIGGVQVIKYYTEAELAEKLREQNVLLIRKLRKETRNNRLGIVEEEALPDDIQRYGGPVEFNPRDLTDDERVDIARRLMDPTTAAEATSQLLEAQLGAPPSRIGSTLREIQQDNLALRAKVEANAFRSDNPDYYVCEDNYQAITGWMVRYGLAPVKANFQRAYDTLKAQGALILGPPIAIEQPPAPVPPVVVPDPTPAPVEPMRRVASGLSRANSSNEGTPAPALGSDITYTFGGRTYTGLAAVKVMPSEEYRRRLLTDRNFAKTVDKLEAEARKPRA